MARIPPGYLPPRELWSERVYTLPEHASYPQRLNSTEELVDRHVAEGRGDRAAILFDDQRISYKALQASVNKLGNALRASASRTKTVSCSGRRPSRPRSSRTSPCSRSAA